MDVKVKKGFLPEIFNLFVSSLSSRQAGSVATAREARSVKSDPAEENWRLRQNLALSYRVINDLALNEGSCNHLSVMAPHVGGSGEEGEVMLIGELENVEVEFC